MLLQKGVLKNSKGDISTFGIEPSKALSSINYNCHRIYTNRHHDHENTRFATTKKILFQP